jgi:hypothetical protein
MKCFLFLFPSFKVLLFLNQILPLILPGLLKEIKLFVRHYLLLLNMKMLFAKHSRQPIPKDKNPRHLNSHSDWLKNSIRNGTRENGLWRKCKCISFYFCEVCEIGMITLSKDMLKSQVSLLFLHMGTTCPHDIVSCRNTLITDLCETADWSNSSQNAQNKQQ